MIYYVIAKISIVIVGILYYANSILLGMSDFTELLCKGSKLENSTNWTIFIGIIAAMFWPISISYFAIREHIRHKKVKETIKEDLSQIAEEL